MPYTGTNSIPILAPFWGTNINFPSGWWDPYELPSDYDYIFYHKDAPSIKMAYPSPTGFSECDSDIIPVKVGDHIYLAVWAYTGANNDPVDLNDIYSGARIGYDFYSASWNRITGFFGSGEPSWQSNGEQTYDTILNVTVRWNSGRWIYIESDFHVPSFAIGDIESIYYGQQVEPGLIAPYVMCALMHASSTTATAWFSEPIMYINPSVVSRPKLSVNSTPSSIPITIDGKEYVTPATFEG